VLSTAGASILALGFIIPIIYFMLSLRYGRVAGDNPWDATGLEWTVSSPPPTHNFHQIPVVTTEAYAYPPEAAEQDSRAWRPGSPL
jgi:cytochrome c oxidase subunit 1